MKRSRFFYLHPEANAGKIAALDALQAAYATYVGTCIDAMLSKHRFRAKAVLAQVSWLGGCGDA